MDFVRWLQLRSRVWPAAFRSPRYRKIPPDIRIDFPPFTRDQVRAAGCAHAGIINTVRHAQSMTGTSRVHAVIGGFHLPTPTFDHVVGPTIEAFIELDPDFIIPTHCTGRKAALQIEQSLPDKFLLNMAGTRIVFQPDHQIRKEK